LILIQLTAASLEHIGWGGVTFALGVAVKAGFDSYFRRRDDERKFVLDKRVGFLEQQLSKFYWPIYLHLQKDNLLYEALIGRDQNPDSGPSRLSKLIEEGVILPNHQEVLKVIEENLHLAEDKEICDLTLRYVRHVKLYEMLRAAKIKGDPISYGEGYPKEYFPLIDKQVHALQMEYDRLLQIVRLDAAATADKSLPPSAEL
jgi:hypothetical protein